MHRLSRRRTVEPLVNMSHPSLKMTGLAVNLYTLESASRSVKTSSKRLHSGRKLRHFEGYFGYNWSAIGAQGMNHLDKRQ